ncbi:hypothetical protein OAN61_00345 [bacterium]|nr:hypothetical protein [bacterium]
MRSAGQRMIDLKSVLVAAPRRLFPAQAFVVLAARAWMVLPLLARP